MRNTTQIYELVLLTFGYSFLVVFAVSVLYFLLDILKEIIEGLIDVWRFFASLIN
jgi:hypothetical protein